MKKRQRKVKSLLLHKETLRELQDLSLGKAAGGLCASVPTSCPEGTVHCCAQK